MGSNPGGDTKYFFFFKKKFFYIFFLSFLTCIELSKRLGMFTNHVDPLGGGEVLLSSCMWKLAYSAISLTEKLLFLDSEKNSPF